MGMFLQGSEVAREFRNQLFNTVEHTADEQCTEEALAEQKIYLNYAKAALDGNKEALLAAAKDSFHYKNCHIRRLEKSNKILANEILTLARSGVPQQNRSLLGTNA